MLGLIYIYIYKYIYLNYIIASKEKTSLKTCNINYYKENTKSYVTCSITCLLKIKLLANEQ